MDKQFTLLIIERDGMAYVPKIKQLDMRGFSLALNELEGEQFWVWQGLTDEELGKLEQVRKDMRKGRQAPDLDRFFPEKQFRKR